MYKTIEIDLGNFNHPNWRYVTGFNNYNNDIYCSIYPNNGLSVDLDRKLDLCKKIQPNLNFRISDWVAG
jgi:hypothetical protein